MNKKRIVIIGAGFAGVYLGKHLAKYGNMRDISVTLISQRNYFLFSPLLHEVATGSLDPLSISEPLPELFRGTCVSTVHASVEKIDHAGKKVITDYGNFTYDELVIATGSETAFYDIPGAKEFGLTLKDLSDAMRIRRQIIEMFEKAMLEKDPQIIRQILSFVVVGGGATGVEIAGELSEFVYHTMLRYFPPISRNFVSITLVSKDMELLRHFARPIRKRALKSLQKDRVNVIFGSSVTKVTNDMIILSDSKIVATATVIWVAGVDPVIPVAFPPFPLNERGRIVVGPRFEVPGFNDVYAIGDVADVVDERGVKMPLLAQVAIREATYLGNLFLGKEKQTFLYRSLGTLVSLGRWQAVGDPLGIPISGFFAWWIWRTTYLFKFMSWKKRFRIGLEWAINFFAPRDISVL